MLGNVQRELKNEPNSGQEEPPGLERIWNFTVKGNGRPRGDPPSPTFSVSNLQEKDNEQPLFVKLDKTFLDV